MNVVRISAWFTHAFCGCFCRSAALAVVATMIVPGASVSADEIQSVFSNDIEAPFLTGTPEETAVDATQMNIDPTEARFLKMQQELDELKASFDVGTKKAELARDAAAKPASVV